MAESMAECVPLQRQESSRSSTSQKRTSPWVACLCVVTFDLELGQAIETIFPEDFPLSSQEKTNICYLAFPDSNSSQIGDSQFHFRIRCNGSGNGGCDPQLGGLVTQSHPCFSTDLTHYFGYSYFRQVKDSENKRGYFQKSVVIVTRLGYHSVFYELARLTAPDFFEHGSATLESAYNNILAWPSPSTGTILSLPFCGNVIYTRIPAKQDQQDVDRSLSEAIPRSPSTIILPHISQVNYFQLLQPVLAHFELLWELVLLNEPIAVTAPSPTLVAQAVEALVSLMRPLKYQSDYRPYFTIHDTEFKDITTKTQSPPAMIIGVTNPFFAKALEHWPHLLRLGDPSHSTGKVSTSKGLYVRKSSGIPLTEDTAQKPGLYTSYKPRLKADKALLKKLAFGDTLPGKRPIEAQNAIIRKHALELTTSFVIPLERYLAKLMPLKRDVSPWKLPPQLKPFDQDQFLATLEINGPQLTSRVKGNWTGLYQQFFKSQNFAGWFSYRRQEANHKLRLMHMEFLSKADVVFWMKGKQEIEIVDFLLRIKRCLNDVSVRQPGPSVNNSLFTSIQRQVQAIVAQLPDDLKSVIKPHEFLPSVITL